MTEETSLCKSGIPFDSPLKGHSLTDLGFITPGLAKKYPF